MTPTEIRYDKTARTLTVAFDDGTVVVMGAEHLRVNSPSAEVQRHGRPVVVTGKENVGIVAIEPVGNYAVRLVFDDGHDSGLYSWSVLAELGRRVQSAG
jgi:DUF971 family protein